MYQLGTKWKLWDLANFSQDDVESITLRGYSTESPVVLPADFWMTNVDEEGRFQGLSVAKVAGRRCPTRRGFYLEEKRGAKGSKGRATWGQVAGHLIEEYCKGLLGHFNKLAQEPSGLDYQKIQALAEEYSQMFWKTRTGSIQKLRDKAGEFETPERLIFLLQRTAQYELTMLGVDYAFSQNGHGGFAPLMQGIPIIFDEEATRINPGDNLGLSEITTPDFIIPEPAIVMGDVKTGIQLRPFHLHTITGYALAYESQHKRDVNFGVVYFFETHATQMSFAQSYLFVIDDLLRRKFLDARNEAYNILQKNEPPPLAGDYEGHCRRCKHLEDCYPSGHTPKLKRGTGNWMCHRLLAVIEWFCREKL